ncbi:hypothetical protein KGD82_13740 [Nocardiopsis eucommiae]|uniref:Uncharacterized protein n=1 Tax=Nocardiopsis eucommiae TaxID=2831970 RepID=A0A975LDC9_9ACTN|nr:hypothetical protein KGD82_13740 [Nocardiopsis eucommiae]
MPTYAPRAGDLVRDADDELWFVYASEAHPTHLYGINASYDPGQTGQPIKAVANQWGPLRLEHRPASITS